jgi:hypothetical protein
MFYKFSRNKRPNNQWWLPLASLTKVLGIHKTAYDSKESRIPLKSYLSYQ